MAELTIDPASIRKALDDFVSSYKPSDTPTQEVGYVATAGDGIAHVTGLPGCMANELLTFEDGTLGLAFNLDAREIGVVILGDFAGIEEGPGSATHRRSAFRARRRRLSRPRRGPAGQAARRPRRDPGH